MITFVSCRELLATSRMLLHKSGSRSKGGRCRIKYGEASAYLITARIPIIAVASLIRTTHDAGFRQFDLTERLTMITTSSDASGGSPRGPLRA